MTSKLSQISPKEFDAAMASRPKLLVCSVEFLANPEVDRDGSNLSDFQIFPGAERQQMTKNICVRASENEHFFLSL